MANTPLIEITGFPEYIRQIQNISDDKRKKGEMIRVLRKVAQGTVKAAKANSPDDLSPYIVKPYRLRDEINPDILRNSIGIIVGKKGNSKENPTVYVGPKTKGKYNGFFAHWVEYGVNVYPRGYRRNRTGRAGKAQAQAQNNRAAKYKKPGAHFMQRTYNQTQGQVTSEAVRSVTNYIQKRLNALSA